MDRYGRIDSLVSEDKRAWHAGKSYWHNENFNNFSIGIILVNSGSNQEIDSNGKLTWQTIDKFADEQMVALVALIDYIKEHNSSIQDQNIVGHSDVAPGRKIDPGIAFDWKYLAYKGHGIYPSQTDGSINSQVLYKLGDAGEGVKSIQANLEKYGYKVPVTGQFDNETQDVV